MYLEPQDIDETILSSIGFDTLKAARAAFRTHPASNLTVCQEIYIPAVLRRGQCWTVCVFPDHTDNVVCHVAGNDGAWYEAIRVKGRNRYDRIHMCRGVHDTLVCVIRPPNAQDQPR
jgi:hypothetical protein